MSVHTFSRMGFLPYGPLHDRKLHNIFTIYTMAGYKTHHFLRGADAKRQHSKINTYRLVINQGSNSSVLFAATGVASMWRRPMSTETACAGSRARS